MACFGPAPGVSGGGVPPGATPVGLLPDRDPIGFLLQWRDTIGIADSTALQLSRLNLRLFRKNNEVMLRVDTLLRSVGIDRRGSRDPMPVPDSVQQRLAPLREQFLSQIAAYRDTARALLTDQQRQRADALEAQLRPQAPGPAPSRDPARSN